MITEAKRESVHRKIDLFLKQLGNAQSSTANGNYEALKPYFYEIMDTVLDETEDLQQRKAESSDIKELIIEVREGFKSIDRRFEQVDKRFEQVDKRFEQVDKRFEQVDKRFEQVDKRFEFMHNEMNRRFEQVDARFNRIYQFMMWMMGIISAGFFGLYLKLFFLK